MRGVYIGNNRALVSLAWGGMLIVSTKDLSLSPSLIIHGVFDVSLTNFLLKTVKPGYTVMDIGANNGCFTVLMGYLVGKQGKVIAYEANPDMCALLTENVVLNYLKPQTEIYNKAVYSEACQLTFYQNEHFHGNCSLFEPGKEYFEYFGEENISKIQVEAEPLDVHLGRYNHIDLVKIDIEGGEYDAFLGMLGLLNKRIVDTIVFELNKMMLGAKWEPFYKLLSSLEEGYNASFHTITDEGQLIPQSLDKLFSHDHINGVVMKV